MNRIVLPILLSISMLLACNKNGKFQTATVKDGGPPAADGCGWLIQIGTTTYSPKNLTKEFQVDNLNIEIKFDSLSTKSNCGWVQNVYTEINIVDIKKK